MTLVYVKMRGGANTITSHDLIVEVEEDPEDAVRSVTARINMEVPVSYTRPGIPGVEFVGVIFPDQVLTVETKLEGDA